VPVALSDLKSALPEGGLFGGGAWQWSPEPLRLSAAEAKEMMAMGYPLAKFQQACDLLYRRSAAGKVVPWLAELLDEGKPDWMVALQRESGMAGQFPRVIRPDLVWAKGHFAVTELDSVPGGIGITAWLSKVYSDAGYEVLGGADGMIEGFRSLMPKGGDILVSEEAKDYLPEMDWLVERMGRLENGGGGGLRGMRQGDLPLLRAVRLGVHPAFPPSRREIREWGDQRDAAVQAAP